MGLLLLNAISARDYPLVGGAVVLSSAAVALGSLLADLATALLDPRTRAGAR
jgi:peptide/nickel transport system permease protein